MGEGAGIPDAGRGREPGSSARSTGGEDPSTVDASVYRLLDAGGLSSGGDPGLSRRRLIEALVGGGAGVSVDGDPGMSVDDDASIGAVDPTHRGPSVDRVMHGGVARRWILDLLDEHGAALADRDTLPGHLTGSALVLEPSTHSVMLMLHAKLGRWLQPGGHADGDHELAAVALREATEETGIEGLRILLPAIDLDVHRIPARGDEPEHMHLDLRFVVVAPAGAQPVRNHESVALRWVPVDQVRSMTDEVGLLRLVERGISAFERFSSGLPEEHTNPSG